MCTCEGLPPFETNPDFHFCRNGNPIDSLRAAFKLMYKNLIESGDEYKKASTDVLGALIGSKKTFFEAETRAALRVSFVSFHILLC